MEDDKELKNLGFILSPAKTKAPDFALKDLSGRERSLRSFQGKLILLNFWGVWCYYCRTEMPSLQRFYDGLKADGLEIVAVDVQDTEAEARAFIQKNRHTFPVLLDMEYRATGLYGIRGFPTTFLVDRDGFIRAMLVGGLEWDAPAVTGVFRKILSGP